LNEPQSLEDIFTHNMSKGVDWLKENTDKANGSFNEQMSQLKAASANKKNNSSGDDDVWNMMGKRLSQVGFGISELAVI
jgi:cation transport regulator ChaB